MLIFFVVLATLLTLPVLLLWAFGERGRFLSSTWRLFREARFRPSALHAYVYGRWTNRYVKTLFQLPLAPTTSAGELRFADTYHGKVLTHDHACSIVTLDRDIPLRDLEQIVPYPLARNLVLHAPTDVVAFECACRHGRATHCEPTQVCMVIGQPFTDFVLDHQPDKARRLTQAEALDLLEAEHLRGHLHSAWFKDAMMNRFYAICNCCKCCCGGIAGMVNRGVPMMAASGYVAERNAELCAHCDECIEACPFHALAKTTDGVALDWDRCMGCGVCGVKCAAGAISLVRDERKGIPLDVRALQSQVS